MSDHKVEYELSMKDGLSPKVKEATEHVSKLEEGLKSVGERAAHVAEAFGISFAIFKGIEFVKEAKEEWEKLEFANSQLEAGLESTGMAAGITFQQLTDSAEKFSHNLKFTKAQVEDMQSILLTFPSVTKATFDSASQAILDMSTRLGTDAKESAIQLGKALQDPVAGLNALHRVGVNTDELKKKFVSVTDTLERQKLIIRELNEEFGGSAKAAAAADATFRYDKAMEDLKETIGELVTDVTKKLTPAFEWFVDTIKDSIQWMKDHKDLMKSIGEAIATTAGAWLIYKGVLAGVNIVQGLNTGATALGTFWQIAWGKACVVSSEGTGLLAAAQWQLNAAWDANPIGVILTALALVTTAIYYCYNHFAKFRAVLWGVWATVKEFASIVGDIFMGLWHMIHGIFTFNKAEIENGFMQHIGAMENAGQRLGSAFKKGYDEGMADFEKDHQKEEGLVPKSAPKAKNLSQGAAIKEPKTKATGSKVVTINVSIKDLVGTYNSNVTNVKENSQKLRDLVIQTLTGAVNDFQVVADH